ncbi:MFS transporter [Streptomyces sp. BI20]|uniref:MFS transporter n=1 Tax=Streptomyces sp. BI20 TaxID=3403460 RepID=UPI003C72B2F8
MSAAGEVDGAALARARRRYASACALQWLPVAALATPLVLLLTSRGLSLPAITGTLAVYSLVTALLELPTGGLSDLFGRRAVVIASGLLYAACAGLLAAFEGRAVLVAAMVLMGAGRALSSGPLEAWWADTVERLGGGPERMREGLARGGVAGSLGLAAGTALGGVLPWALDRAPAAREAIAPLTPLAAPVVLAVAAHLLFCLFATVALREPAPAPAPAPERAGGARRASLTGTLRAGLWLAGRDAVLRRVLIGAVGAGGALATMELLTPGRAASVVGSAETGALLFAGLSCAGFLSNALGNRLAPALARRCGDGARAARFGLSAGALGVLALAVGATGGGTGARVLSVLGFVLVYLGLGAAAPNENELLHRRAAGSGARATALSVQSLALQLAGAGCGLLLGALPAGAWPWLPAAALLFGAALSWGSRSLGEVVEESRKPVSGGAGVGVARAD